MAATHKSHPASLKSDRTHHAGAPNKRRQRSHHPGSGVRGQTSRGTKEDHRFSLGVESIIQRARGCNHQGPSSSSGVQKEKAAFLPRRSTSYKSPQHNLLGFIDPDIIERDAYEGRIWLLWTVMGLENHQRQLVHIWSICSEVGWLPCRAYDALMSPPSAEPVDIPDGAAAICNNCTSRQCRQCHTCAQSWIWYWI